MRRRLEGTAAVVATASGLATIYVLSTLPTPLYVSYREAFGFSQVVLTIVYAAYVVGVVASVSSLMLADVLFGALVAVFALSALVFGVAGKPPEKA